MRKVIAGLLLALVLALPGGAYAAEPAPPGIRLDGLPLDFPVAPTIVEGRTMVPFRAIAEALGVTVTWHGESRTIDAEGLGRAVRLGINQKVMWIDGVPVTLDVPPMIVGDRTLVPLRAFSTAFDARVAWDDANRTAIVESPARPMRTLGFYALRSYPERQYVARFSDVAYGWATLTADGEVDLVGGEYRWPEPDGDVSGERLLEQAAAAGTRRHLMIHAVDGRVDLTTLVLDPAMADKVAGEVAAVVKEKRFDGVVLDLESLGHISEGDTVEAVRAGFVRLVAAVAREMRAAGKETIVSVHPLNGWFHGYDYAALAAEADLLQVMAHDYRQDGNPEPPELVEEAIRLALKETTREKLLLGVVAAYETPETLVQKAGLAKRYSLAGLSLWRLGDVKQERMEALETTIVPLQP